MDRCDFCSIMTCLKNHISESNQMSQPEFLYEIFADFMDSQEIGDFSLDNGLVCRWMTGQAKISPKISSYYAKPSKQELLAATMDQNLMPLMADSRQAIQDVYTLFIQDDTISEAKKTELASLYKTPDSQLLFLAKLISFGMERQFVKRDARNRKLIAGGVLSPAVLNYIMDSEVPKPCRHFLGREDELEKLHAILEENSKVFLYGIAGIGKSELAKAYAKTYRKKYTNILYLMYSGDLRQDIIDLDFADDLPEDTEENRFRKHNRFLRTLKEDTLLIIDNFNTTATKDSFLSVVLKYRCRVIFTTRSRFDNYTSMDLEEISDPEALLSLMRCFYSDADKYSSVLKQIIQTVHSHTLAVELSARLLETGILEPQKLLTRLQAEKSALDATDTIDIIKDGQSRKATYYDHIHTLFSLYQLSPAEKDIMRGLSFAPAGGISGRLYAHWLKLSDMNIINGLIEKGFIQTQTGRQIALHPMIQEVTVDETAPSVKNSSVLLCSLQDICLRHGEDVSYYKQLFQTIENIVRQIENDDTPAYLLFLENAFPYMEKYHYTTGMELIISKLSTLLQDKTSGSGSDRALLLDYQAACEAKTEKAIKMEKEAISLITEITPDNALLVSILYSNLGGFYKKAGELELAQQSMEHGIQILEQFDLLYYHDSIAQTTNYAVLLTDMGQPEKGLSALRKLSRIIRDFNSDKTIDYALVQEAMGGICLTTGEVQQATSHFKKALAIYELIFDEEPNVIEAKKQEITQTYIQAGINLGKQLLN